MRQRYNALTPLVCVLVYLAFAASNVAAADLIATTTIASDSKTNYSATGKSVTLRASVSTADGAVNEGTVSFQLKRFGIALSVAVVSAVVSNGNASVSYPLPAGQALGHYTITAAFSGSATLAASSDNTKTLTIRGEEPEIFSSLTASGTVGLAFSYKIQATGTTPITFTAQPIPAGLLLNRWLISGFPIRVVKS